MKLFAAHRGWLTGVGLAALVAVTTAPLAEAGRDHGRKFKHRGGKVVRHVHESPRVVRHYHSGGSGAGPAIAGFVGGLILGTVLSEHAEARVAVRYTYWDPYCGRPYPSMDAYHAHCRVHSHGYRVRTVEIPAGYDWDDYDCDRYGRSYWRRGGHFRADVRAFERDRGCDFGCGESACGHDWRRGDDDD